MFKNLLFKIIKPQCSSCNKVNNVNKNKLIDNHRMTLDEAIIHAEQKAIEQNCTPCGDEHFQIVKWLLELKEYRRTDPEKMDGYWKGLHSRRIHSPIIGLLNEILDK